MRHKSLGKNLASVCKEILGTVQSCGATVRFPSPRSPCPFLALTLSSSPPPLQVNGVRTLHPLPHHTPSSPHHGPFSLLALLENPLTQLPPSRPPQRLTTSLRRSTPGRSRFRPSRARAAATLVRDVFGILSLGRRGIFRARAGRSGVGAEASDPRSAGRDWAVVGLDMETRGHGIELGFVTGSSLPRPGAPSSSENPPTKSALEVERALNRSLTCVEEALLCPPPPFFPRVPELFWPTVKLLSRGDELEQVPRWRRPRACSVGETSAPSRDLEGQLWPYCSPLLAFIYVHKGTPLRRRGRGTSDLGSPTPSRSCVPSCTPAPTPQPQPPQ